MKRRRKLTEMSEMSRKELGDVEKFADKLLNPLDIEFTNHFFDRLSDPRNRKQITKAELISFFKRLARHKNKFVDFIKKYTEFVVKHDRYKLNIPFVQVGNKLVAKTIMRKKNFMTRNGKFVFEDYKKYLKENY